MNSPVARFAVLSLFAIVSQSASAFMLETNALDLDATVSKPNIIVYMVDDLGWNHISSPEATMNTNRREFSTPNVERLAKEGMSFTHAYAQPNCAPTRAAMLSGQYSTRINNGVYAVNGLNRFGRGGVSKSNAKFRGPNQRKDVASAAITIAEAMRKNGYATAHIGKYHVGGHESEETMPENSGFDINLGGTGQGHQPKCFASVRDGKWGFRKLGRGDFDKYAAPYSGEYLQRRGLPSSLSGSPKHVCDALGDALEDTIKKLAKDDKPFYLQFHSYAVHGPVRARPDLKAASAKRLGLSGKKAEYPGFLAGMDENLGRLLAMVDDPNQDGNASDSIANNTLILFTSDNGGTHADNAPLRGKKGMFTEGGIRVPLIARWPGAISEGVVTDRLVHSVDYFPTFVELAGNQWQPPVSEHPLDGQSFARAMKRPDSAKQREPIFYLFPGYLDNRATPCAIVVAERENEFYKLSYFYETNSWELYCLSLDSGEKNNLIQSHRNLAMDLSKQMSTWLSQEHPTWKPKFPLSAGDGNPVPLPALFSADGEN